MGFIVVNSDGVIAAHKGAKASTKSGWTSDEATKVAAEKNAKAESLGIRTRYEVVDFAIFETPDWNWGDVFMTKGG